MPVPVFEQPMKKPTPVVTLPSQEKISGVAIFFSVVLVSMMILTMEMALRDANKTFNPHYKTCYQSRSMSIAFRPAKVSPDCNLSKYEGIRLVLHTDLVVPVIIITGAVLLINRKKKLSSYGRALYVSFLSFIAWLLLRMLSETEYYLLKHLFLFGKYIVLITLIVLLVVIIIYIQKKYIKKPLT